LPGKDGAKLRFANEKRRMAEDRAERRDERENIDTPMPKNTNRVELGI
jgi:hypothetical protein